MIDPHHRRTQALKAAGFKDGTYRAEEFIRGWKLSKKGASAPAATLPAQLGWALEKSCRG